MTSVRHRIGIRGTVSAIYDALTQPEGLSGWWSTTASGAQAVGQEIDLGFGGVLTLAFLIREMEPNRSLVLECPDGPGPWNQSRLSFTLEDAGEQVFLTLIHSSDEASDDTFLYFNTKWPLYLLSLRDLIETGKGRPSPHDIPIYYGDNIHSNTD